MKRALFIFISIMILMAACTVPQQAGETPAPSTAAPPEPVAQTFTLTPTTPPSATPAPTRTPQPPPEPTLFLPFKAYNWADNVHLRVNPGTLFPSARLLPQNSALWVLGKAPGGEWLLVQTEDNIKGWMYTLLMESDSDLLAVPVVSPANVQVVAGRVLDQREEPVSGIQFSIIQGAGSAAPRSDAQTDENGWFFAFLPAGEDGGWTISFTAISCASNRMDADCNCKDGVCGQVEPASLLIELPLEEKLAFSWLE